MNLTAFLFSYFGAIAGIITVAVIFNVMDNFRIKRGIKKEEALNKYLRELEADASIRQHEEWFKSTGARH